jgi:hypothetical protein
MSKTKIILIAIGGVIALATIALLVLICNAFSNRSGQAEELDVSRSDAERLVRLPIYPSAAGVRALESNRMDFVSWSADARALAARGDRAFERTTPPAFKTFLVEEARRLSELPGAVEGKLVKAGFAFGFAEYISAGVMPKEEDLPRLQREWYDVSTVIEALAVTGVTEIAEVTIQAEQKASDDDASKGRKNKRKANKAKAGAEAASLPNVTRFSVTFKAQPQGIVNAVNALAASPRFIVIDDLSFLHETDALASALDGDKKDESTSRRTSRRRRNSASSENATGFGAANGEGANTETNAVRIVSDPSKILPFKVSMQFSVYDFRTKENARPTGAASKESTKKEDK